MQLTKIALLSLTSSLLFGASGLPWLTCSPVSATPSFNSAQATTASVVRSGSFVTTEQDHPTTGTARIITENGKRYLEFDRAFDTASGPDVRVILHRDRSVPVKLDESDYITLASLKSFNGAQRYAIPETVNLDEFNSVAIWCRQFNITFGYASLPQ